MRRAQAAEGQGRPAEVDRRPDELGRDVDARGHAEQGPQDRAIHERRDDAVFVMLHVSFQAKARFPFPARATVRPSRLTSATSR